MTYKTFEEYFDLYGITNYEETYHHNGTKPFKAEDILDSWNEARKYPEEKIQKTLDFINRCKGCKICSVMACHECCMGEKDKIRDILENKNEFKG